MREIKFRAWDKETGKMVDGIEITGRYPFMTCRRFRSILRRMEHLKNICRLVRIIEKEAERLDAIKAKMPKDHKLTLKDINDTILPNIENVKKAYMSEYKCGRSKVNAVYTDALKGNYISESPIFGKSTLKLMHHVEVTTDGRRLNGTLFKIPTSRYNAWLAENSNLENFLGGGAFGIVVALIVWLCKTYLLKHN